MKVLLRIFSSLLYCILIVSSCTYIDFSNLQIGEAEISVTNALLIVQTASFVCKNARGLNNT